MSAAWLILVGTTLPIAPAAACAFARDFSADFAAGYADSGNKGRSSVYFESVVLARVTQAAPTVFEHTETDWQNPYWAGTAIIEKTLSGRGRKGTVGISQLFINSCGPVFEMPKAGERLIIYFERGRPPEGITTSAYTLDFAKRYDRRVREALAK